MRILGLSWVWPTLFWFDISTHFVNPNQKIVSYVGSGIRQNGAKCSCYSQPKRGEAATASATSARFNLDGLAVSVVIHSEKCMGKPLTGKGDCDTAAVKKSVELGRKLAITGTPTQFFADGERIQGAVPLTQIEKKLDQIGQ